MINIKKVNRGPNDAIEFTSGRNIVGLLSFDDNGFSFDKQVYQDNIIELAYSSALNVNCTDGNIYTVTLTGNTTLTLQNSEVGVYTFIFKQDSTGGRTLTLPDEYLVVSDAGLPDFSGNAANTVDVISILYDGTNYYVTESNNFVAVSTL